jgi:biotin synthase
MKELNLNDLKVAVLGGHLVTTHEALWLADYADKEALYGAADEIRAFFMGTKMDLCTIMNARSGECTEDCKWCAQSKFYNTGIGNYELVGEEESVALAVENRKKGVERFSLVTSGRALSSSNVKKACSIYRAISQTSDIHLCASMGLLGFDALQQLKLAGVEHYHCNIETAPSLFSSLCTTHTFEEKLKTIKAAREAGLLICSGGIIGMGETMEQRIEMAIALQQLEVNSIPINILNPIEGTPLSGSQMLSDEDILTTIALFRFINPKAHIRFAGGRNLIAHIQSKALRAGVSAALVGDYLTTIGTNIDEDRVLFQSAGFDC